MSSRRHIAAAMAVLALLAPLASCSKGPRSIKEIEAENAADKPSYPDLVRVDTRIGDIVEQARDAKSATASVLAYVDTRLGQSGDDAARAYGRLLLARIASAKASHPQDCPGVIRGDTDAIDRNADTGAEHAWLLEALRPARPGGAISRVVIGASLPAVANLHPRQGESACDISREMVEAMLAQPPAAAAAGFRSMGMQVGARAL